MLAVAWQASPGVMTIRETLHFNVKLCCWVFSCYGFNYWTCLSGEKKNSAMNTDTMNRMKPNLRTSYSMYPKIKQNQQFSEQALRETRTFNLTPSRLFHYSLSRESVCVYLKISCELELFWLDGGLPHHQSLNIKYRTLWRPSLGSAMSSTI